MRAVIFANGDLCFSPSELTFHGEELIIAADGGSQHCLALDLLPDILIGDLDSTSESLRRDWEAKGVEIISHPERKDETDLELALLQAQKQGVDEIHVYGAVGGRLDMTFANLMLLAHPQLQIPVTLICGREEIHVLRAGDTLHINGSPGDTISLISLQPGTNRITTENLEYPLKDQALGYGVSRGISNSLTAQEAAVHLQDGLLAVFHLRSGSSRE